MVKKYIYFLSTVLISQPLLAQIYKWTDAQGNVHFTDKPHPGAEQIQLPQTQTYTPPPQTQPENPPASEMTTDVKAEEDAYTSVTILQPEDQATIRNNQGYVPIIVQLEPELRKGDTIQMIFDGNPIGEPQTTSLFALRDINRGSHTIAVKILNAKGKELNTSETVTFFMQRPRVGMVPETRKTP